MQQKEQENAADLRNAMMLQSMKKDLSKEEIANLSSQLKDQREAQKLGMMLKAQNQKEQLDNQKLQLLLGSQNKKDDNKNFQKKIHCLQFGAITPQQNPLKKSLLRMKK